MTQSRAGERKQTPEDHDSAKDTAYHGNFGGGWAPPAEAHESESAEDHEDDRDGGNSPEESIEPHPVSPDVAWKN